MNPEVARWAWLWQPSALALVLLAVDLLPVLATGALLAVALVGTRWGARPAVLLAALAVVGLGTPARPAGLLFALAAVVAAGLDRPEAALLGLPGAAAVAQLVAEGGLTPRLAVFAAATALAALVAVVRPVPGTPPEWPRLAWALPAVVLLVAPQTVPGAAGELVEPYAAGAAVAAATAALAVAAATLRDRLRATSATMGGPPDPGDA